MVLYKARVWYEAIIQPLRRLAAHAQTSTQAQGANTAPPMSPDMSSLSEIGRSLRRPFANPSSTSSAGAGSSTQAETLASPSPNVHTSTKWRRAFLQHPLDVIIPETPLHTQQSGCVFSQASKPFSTSAGDQARRQPKDNTCSAGPSKPRQPQTQSQSTKPRTSGSPPVFTARAKDGAVGSKRFRKYVHDKIKRKSSQRLQKRRKSKFSILNLPMPITAGIISDLKSSESVHVCSLTPSGTMANSNISCSPLTKTEGQDCKEDVITATSQNNPSDVAEETLSNKNVRKLLTPHTAATACKDFSNNYPKLVRASSSPPKAPTKGFGIPKTRVAPGGAPTNSADYCNCIPGRLERERHTKTFRENIEEAVQGFKCSLWKGAITGDAALREAVGVKGCVPCYVSAKSG